MAARREENSGAIWGSVPCAFQRFLRCGGVYAVAMALMPLCWRNVCGANLPGIPHSGGPR